MERLSVLVIDTHAKFTRPNSGPDGGVDDHIHICPLIAAHLTSLTKLHIRMRTLCPDILKVPGDKRDLRLKNLVINFYQPRTGEFTHSMRCTTGQEPPAGVGVMRLMDDIRRHALILKTKMKSPEILRLLTFQLPSFNVHSYDLLKGRTMVLGSRRAWDEDGGVVDEEWEPEPPSEPDGEFTEHLDGFN